MTPLQAAYDVIDRIAAPETLHRAKLRGLMAGYDARWLPTAHEYRVIGIEETLTGPLMNIESGRSSRTFTLAAKLDLRLVYIGDDSDSHIIMDHKTASDDIEDPDAPYWRQLIVESQPSHYMLLEWLKGRKVDYAIWDVIRKPGIAPRQLTKLEVEQLDRSGTYCGRSFHREEVLWAKAEKRETFGMYEARLAHDVTHERPERHYARHRVPRLDAELQEYADELWMHAEEMRIAIAADRHPRNSGACMQYGSPCKYLGICSGHDTPDSGKWRRKAWVHPELPILNDGDGKELLTNSRIRCFQTCRRKHYYDYLLGIERVEGEDKEALIFGTMMHEALAAWWQAVKDGQDSRTGKKPLYAGEGVSSGTPSGYAAAADHSNAPAPF